MTKVGRFTMWVILGLLVIIAAYFFGIRATHQ
jgi:hypothetical protein